MRLDHDDTQAGIAAALRAALATGMSPTQVHDCLAGLDMYAVELHADAGGLELGLSRGVIVCQELGRVAAPDGYRAAALLSDRDNPAALSMARIRQAAYLLGCAEGAHALAAARAVTRSQFGTQLGSFQAIAFPLAAQSAELAAIRLLVHRAAWLADQDAPAGPLRLAAAQALASAAELAFAVTRHAMHVHGAYGMTEAAGVARYYRTVAAEATRWGSPVRLWREAAALRTPARHVVTQGGSA